MFSVTSVARVFCILILSIQIFSYNFIKQLKRVAPAGEVVIERALHLRAAVTRRLLHDLLCREPHGPHHATVERASGFMAGDMPGKGEAQVGDVLFPDTASGKCR